MTDKADEMEIIKARIAEVLFDNPKIAQAMSRVNVFVVDHHPGSKRITASLLPDQAAVESDHNLYGWLEYVHPEDRETIRQQWQDVMTGKRDVFEATYRFQVKGQCYRWISNLGTMVYRSDNVQSGFYIGADRDITEERRLQQLLEEERARLAHMLIHDGFLNIPNRRYLDSQQTLFFHNDGQTPMAILVLDIDNFKDINTELTHKGGDVVLQQVVDALRGCLGPDDLLARYGGDEFVVVLPRSSLEQSRQVAQCMIDTVSTIALPTKRLGQCSISIGLYQGCPQPEQNFWDYFEQADRLLFMAKQAGKARFESGWL
ncbi:GGDEF domain [Gynuella sunshinyii YC6258]|uniref:GGDEF domain n=2 Tax=Gynuella sunshinyii TaxID=1445505 RepID=A0A0C5VD18_9GAMM|nr:GGDEF domain [Gynuella sunshinyii YC6258]